MRNKLFFAFLVVILLALISNILYERFITQDFEEFMSGLKEDRLYWIMASIEGSYGNDGWDDIALHEALHWAIMLGFDISVQDVNNQQIIDSRAVISMLSPAMKKRMLSISDISSASGEYEHYPLYQEGREIGAMLVRQLSRPGFEEKENLFKERGRYFLLISFLIAGGGAILLSFFFSLFFSRPLKQMKKAVQSLAGSDFSVRVPVNSTDELGRLAQSFNFMAEALQREEALRKHLTSNIAHELRTPLTVMKANIEAMSDGIIADQALGLENIRTETERLIRLVEGIEDITKAEASFFSRKSYAALNLKKFLGDISGRMLPLAAEKGLLLTASGPDDLTVVTDPEKLERIIQNVLSNAIRYTEEGSISISHGEDGKGVFIEISDSGVGMSEERILHIFKRFYRSEASEGVGLGLAIVKELLDAMGGTIEVKSHEGKGSSFRIWLPQKQ